MHRWLASHGMQQGAIVPVPRLHSLTRTWYTDRLDPGWRPRDGAEALRRFAEAGLGGPFWSLP